MNELDKEFINLYNNTTLPVRKIRVELGLSQYEYYKLRNHLKEFLHLRRWSNKKKTNNQDVKNYSYCNSVSSFQIRKKGKYYASVKTEKIAKRLVELLEENDWDYSLRDDLKKQAIMEVMSK